MRTFIFPVIAALSLNIQSFAADVGTYRPGNIYLSVPAQSHDQCSAQCSGDAQCKSWNFIRVAQNRNFCEFNAKTSQPIASAFSISGDNPSAFDSTRLIPAGHRTTRIGESSTMRIVPQNGTVTRVGSIPRQHQTSQQAHRPMPPAISQRQHRSAASPQIRPVGQLSPQSHPVRPTRQFRHSLDSRQTVQARPEAIRTNRSPFAPRTQQVPNQPAVTTAKFTPMLDTQSAAMAATNVTSAPISQPLPAPPMPSISDIPQNVLSPSVESALAGGPISAPAPTNNSLYGSLYDDVKAPRSLSSEDIPLDLDAPIPTVTSVPIQRLDVQPF